MHRSRYQSAYREKHGVSSSVAAPVAYDDHEAAVQPGPALKNAQFAANLKDTQARRDKLEFESQPTCWQTTYNSQFDAWKVTKVNQESRRRNPSATMAANLRARDEANLHRGPYSQNLLEGRDMATNYQRDFGAYGSKCAPPVSQTLTLLPCSPLSRHKLSARKSLSKTATTNELL
jgi:hypothetical protein